MFKWDTWKAILLGIVGTLVCAYLIQPVLDRAPAVVLGVAATVSQGWENAVFQDAAQPPKLEPLLFLLILCIAAGLLAIGAIGSNFQKAAKNRVLVTFALSIMLLTFFTVIVRAASDGIDRCFRARLAVVAPQITDQESKELVARWNLMRTRADFEAIADTLGEKAQKHNVGPVIRSLAGPDRTNCL